MAEKRMDITPETSVIDVISRYRETEKIFKRLEAETGACICCQGLFDTLGEAAARFGFDLNAVLREIRAVIADPENEKKTDQDRGML